MTHRTSVLLLSLMTVAALAACKEDGPRTPPAPRDPGLVINGTAIDPMCFLQRSDDDKPAYPTTGCGMDGTYTADAQSPPPLSEDFVSTSYFYVDPDMPDGKFPGFVGYRYLGDYSGLKAVEMVENGGGTGVFTSVQLLRPEKDGTLRIVETLAGGDRCNGGISEAFMDGRTLVYSVNLTPFDFLTVAEHNPKNLQAYDDLDACAICCYGTLQFVDQKPGSVTLTPEAIKRGESTPVDEQTTQSCFDEAFAKQVAEKQVLSLKEMKEFVVGFHQTCTAQ